MAELLSAYPLAGSRFAWRAPVVFDASVQALALLGEGICLHVLSDEQRKDPQQMLSYFAAEQIDWVDTTPSLSEVLLEQCAAEQALPNQLIGG
jgi:hypothetical protein